MNYFNVPNFNSIPFNTQLNPKPLQNAKGRDSVQNTDLKGITPPNTKDLVSFSSPSIHLLSNVNRFSNLQDPVAIEERLLGSLDRLDSLGVPHLIQNEIPEGLQNNPSFALSFSEALVNRLDNQA